MSASSLRPCFPANEHRAVTTCPPLNLTPPFPALSEVMRTYIPELGLVRDAPEWFPTEMGQ